MNSMTETIKCMPAKSNATVSGYRKEEERFERLVARGVTSRRQPHDLSKDNALCSKNEYTLE